MNEKTLLFRRIGEPYAAGLFEEPERGAFARYARALRRYWEACALHAYGGGLLYPAGPKVNDPYAVLPEYSYTVSVDEPALADKDPRALEWMREETGRLAGMASPHTVGGAGYTHSIPRYGRVAREGLDSYRERAGKLPAGDFRDGLLDLLAGIRAFHKRALAHLEKRDADPALLAALARVPFGPARTLYEALVCWNFVYYLDFCDNPGRLDADLAFFYRGEDITGVLRAFFQNVDENSGWSGALGPDYNPLTLQCLKAIRGCRRPSLELRVTPDMPGEVWEAAAEAIASGGGQPSLYNEPLYQKALALRFPEIPEEDRLRFCGGGCSETMLAGISNVGSLDAGINLALVLEESLRHLPKARDFAGFFNRFTADMRSAVADTLDMVSRFQQARAACRPQPMRTLLVDDCIDRGTDFNAGGARHSWSVVNVAGLINVIDSLLAVRELVYRKKAYGPVKFLELLEKEDEALYARLRDCPHYGADDSDADELAAALAGEVWDAFGQRKPWLGGAFLPASIQFATYADAGRGIGPTPDGRRRGEPLCDSVAAIRGRDGKGPAAMLSSAARMKLDRALGTPVTNLKLSREHMRKALKPLTLGYFAQGGMQLQIICVSRASLLEAQKKPRAHENLIVRIGGYSEYFNRLTPELQQTVIDRTEF